MRATLSTREEVAGAKRKLAWFALKGRGLYFEVGSPVFGSHTSYHVDGNVFRTSPATQGRPRFQGRQLPLNDFRGWHQFGIAMVTKTRIAQNPALKGRDQRPGNLVAEVPVAELPADTLNVVVELVHRESLLLVARSGLTAPPGALGYSFSLGELVVVLTVLGRPEELLVQPLPDGFSVRHFNSRFSANAEGVVYTWEAYG